MILQRYTGQDANDEPQYEPTGIHVQDDIRLLTVARFTAYNKHLLGYLHLGTEHGAVRNHFVRLDLFLRGQDAIRAKTEFDNLQLTINSLNRGERPDLLALAALVDRVGDTPCVDLSDEGLKRTVELLEQEGITESMVREALDEVAGKLLPA